MKVITFRYSIEPCQFTTYDTETISYDRNSKMAHNMVETWFQISDLDVEPTENGTILMLTYQTTDMKVTQKVKILDESSFISSVGGNLGLFIGFSFLDSLFVLYKWIFTRSTK